jgi:anti-sigma factor RsiW
MNEHILELLYRSLDGPLGETEQRQLEAALAASRELRAERERIIAMRDALSSSAPDSFGPFFTERVMRRILTSEDTESHEDLFFVSLYRLFRPLVAVGAALVITLVTLNLWESDEVSLAAALSASGDTVDVFLKTPLESFLEESL